MKKLLSFFILSWSLQTAYALPSSCQASPYQVADGVPILTVSLEKQAYQLLLDTGGDIGLILKKDLLNHLKTLQPTGKSLSKGGVTGKITILQEFILPKIEISGKTYHHISTVEDHRWGLGHHDAHAKVDGFIGLSAMAEHDFVLHPQKKRMYIDISNTCLNSLSKQWSMLPLVFDDVGIHINLEITGEKKHFLLDSASTVSIISPSALPKVLKPVKCETFPTGKGCIHFKNNEVTIAGQPLTALHVVEIPALEQEGIDGILGADILDKLVIYYGFSVKKLGLSPVKSL